MNKTIKLEYTGKVQPPKDGTNNGELLPYLPSKNLVDAVNLTIFLEKRPLLIKGEPGSGKTRLAQHVAFELGLPFEAWFIKSTSRAKDGLYTYDAIHRLHDAQLAGSRGKDNTTVENANNYIKFGPLGRAFQNNKRTVVLIDEIDKADIDFPNDLLLELDEQRFVIEETGKTIKAKEPPIVFITSNNEKVLPDAFLRRCLFHYIEFPDPDMLVSIVDSHFSGASPKVVKMAVERFVKLRIEMSQQRSDKKVSTSELLDWFDVLRHYPEDEIISKLNGQLPFPEILLKSWEDHNRYLQSFLNE